MTVWRRGVNDFLLLPSRRRAERLARELPRALRSEGRDRARGTRPCSSWTRPSRAAVPRVRRTAEFGVAAIEVLDDEPPAGPRSRRTSSSASHPRPHARFGSELDDASSRPKRGWTCGRSASRRAATRARSPSRGCTTAGTRTAGSGFSPSTASSPLRRGADARRQGRRPHHERGSRPRPRRRRARVRAPRGSRRRGARAVGGAARQLARD